MPTGGVHAKYLLDNISFAVHLMLITNQDNTMLSNDTESLLTLLPCSSKAIMHILLVSIQIGISD